MTGIALSKRNGSRELVFFSCVTRSAACLPSECRTFSWHSIDVTGQTILAKFLDGGIVITRRVKYRKRCNSCFSLIVRYCVDPEMSGQIVLGAKGKADICDRARICGLDAGHHALDVVAVVRFAA